MRRASTLAWLGVLGPPLAWFTQHIAGWSLSLADCPDNARGPGWDVPVNTATLSLGVATSIAAALCGIAAVAAWRATRGVDETSAPPAGRVHFLAVTGMTITPLFVAMIVMSSAGAIVAQDCVQS